MIERLARRYPAVGDDAAVLADGVVASVDTLVEGVDWRPEWSGADDVGWKAIMVNASDVAAMGGSPESFLISVVASEGFDLDAFYDGVDEALALTGGTVVGGDLSGGPVTVVSVCVLGRVEGDPVLRSGAAVGQGVFVSAALGAAARDLRAGGGDAHRRPRAYLGPRPAGATALIDVSDGLIADCAHIAEASGVCLALDDVPVAPGADLDDALFGGDDYVLVACAPLPISGWSRIGACVEGAGVTWRGKPIVAHGFEHSL